MRNSARRYARIALTCVFLVLVAILYFVARLPLWACALMALAAMVVNSFVLRVEDGEFIKHREPRE